MIIKRCDRCKNEMKLDYRVSAGTFEPHYELCRVSDCGFRTDIDLCKECQIGLDAWLIEGKKQTDEM